MQIMYFGRRSGHIATLITNTYQEIKSVQCTSFEDVLTQIAHPGGDPYKIGIVPILQTMDDDIRSLTTFNGFRLVSTAEIPFLTSFLDGKRSEEILIATSSKNNPTMYGWTWR